MKLTRCLCDICGSEIYARNDSKSKEFRCNFLVQIIINRKDMKKRVLALENLDICNDCMSKIIDGKTLWSYEKDKYTFERDWSF